MNVAIVLRLLPAALREGRLVGEVEIVDTGEHAVVQSTEQLVGFLCERAGALRLPSEPAQSPRQRAP